MGFPVETVEGEIVEVEKAPDGTLVAEDGRTFKRSIDALKMEVMEAADAIGDAVEQIGDVVEATGDLVEAALADPVEAAKEVIDLLDDDDEATATAE